jgi:dTDP-4-dehydrorhamnose reductase
MKKVLVSGGGGKLAKEIIKQSKECRVILPDKEEMDVRKLKDVLRCIDSYNPDYFIHAAAYTRPMSDHQKNPHISLQTNIIGTSNVTLACMKYNTKLIYISTDYVYPGVKGNYHEDDALSPFQVESDGNTKYGWSKLGGECAVRMYDNSLILRLCMCDYPFPHDVAFEDVKKSLMYNFEAASVILKLLDYKGVMNVGGKSQSIYDFASKKNQYIKKGSKLDVKDVIMAPDTTMDTSRLRKALNK